MTYQQAGRVAVVKRGAGWGFFFSALISRLSSLLGLLV